jgi:signal transduction histidine kinase
VRDRGNGIPTHVTEEILSDRSTVFKPYGSQRTDGGGLGLGLRLSKAIFKRHQAHIQISGRTDGAGTLVRVELPAL